MKGIKITYWAATGILALMMIFSAYAYFTDPAVAQGFQHLGFPAYFRIELGIAKLIGAVLLLAPVSARIKDWTYAGFAICFVSAFIAHTASGDPVSNRMGPLIFLAVLITSYVTYLKRHKAAVPAV